MFSTTNVSDKWKVRGFERMLSYEQYPEEKSRLWLSPFKKKLINLHGGLPDVTTNIYHKSCAHQPHSHCYTFFHRNLSYPKSSEDTLLCLSVLYVTWTCWSRLIYTKLSSHRSFILNMYLITMMYFSVKFPSLAPKKTRNWYFSHMSADFRFLK